MNSSVLQPTWLWRILSGMRKPQPPKPPEPDWPYDLARELGLIKAELHQMRIEMSALTDAVAANTAATSANTDATNAAVAKLTTPGTPSDAQEVADAVTALTANTTQIEANTAALTNAQPAA